MLKILASFCFSEKEKRVTRGAKARLVAAFPRALNLQNEVGRLNIKKVEALRGAIRTIEMRRKRILRERPKNSECCITRKSLKKCDRVFKYVQENEYVRGYDAEALAFYFTKSENCRDPISRIAYSSVELRRLVKLVPKFKKIILEQKIDFWRFIFIKTTEEMLYEILPLVLLSEEEPLSFNGQNEALSTFLLQSTYLYASSKVKYRTLKRTFLARASNSERATQTLRFLDSICFSIFLTHGIEFAFQGDRAVPILRNFGSVAQLC